MPRLRNEVPAMHSFAVPKPRRKNLKLLLFQLQILSIASVFGKNGVAIDLLCMG